MLTESTGQVQLEVPRDRDGSFEPQIVRKRQRRLTGVDEIVLSLYAKGLTTGEISAHFAEIYGASVSKETISRITDKVIEEMSRLAATGRWTASTRRSSSTRSMVKVRDGQVANRPVYAAIGVTLAGEKDILGLVGWHRRRGRQVLDERAHRPAQPRRGAMCSSWSVTG